MHGNVEQSYCQPHVCRSKAIFIWPHVIKVKHSLEEISTLADCFVSITLPFAPRASSHHKDLPVSQDQTGRAALPLEGESKWGSYKQPNLSGQCDIPPPPPTPTLTLTTFIQNPQHQAVRSRALVSSFNQCLRPACDLDRHERHVIYFLPGMCESEESCEMMWEILIRNKSK